MNQMELYQILVFFKVEAFHPFIADTQSENIFFQTQFCEGNKPNGVDSNICFDKGRLFILLLLLPYLISLSSKLFYEGNEPNGAKSNFCFFTKWRHFILLLLIPNVKTFSLKLFL
jgi:hypothetical protein